MHRCPWQFEIRYTLQPEQCQGDAIQRSNAHDMTERGWKQLQSHVQGRQRRGEWERRCSWAASLEDGTFSTSTSTCRLLGILLCAAILAGTTAMGMLRQFLQRACMLNLPLGHVAQIQQAGVEGVPLPLHMHSAAGTPGCIAGLCPTCCHDAKLNISREGANCCRPHAHAMHIIIIGAVLAHRLSCHPCLLVPRRQPDPTERSALCVVCGGSALALTMWDSQPARAAPRWMAS